MPITGSPEWHERRRRILEAESQQPEQLWYLSYAMPGIGWLGGIFTMAPGFLSAVGKAKWLGISPGGEVKGNVLESAGNVPAEFLDRFLSKADIEKHFGGAERF